MAVRQPRLMTLEEFNALPEGPPYYEFEEGEIVPVTSPQADHQEVLAELLGATRAYCRRTGIGRIYLALDVYLPDGRVYIPDLVFLGKEKVSLLSAVDNKIHGVPDLVVEITSTNEARDRAHKFQVYQTNGVAWYWILNPKLLLIEEYKLSADGYVRVSTTALGEDFTPKLFPGLSINLAQLLGIEVEEQPA